MKRKDSHLAWMILSLCLMAPELAHAIVFNIAWTGSNGYSMTGMFSYDDSLIGTGAINETQLDTLMIEGFLGMASIGTWDLADGQGTGAGTFNFNFDTTTEQFLLGGNSSSGSGQLWNFFGNPGLGFGSGNRGQLLSNNGPALNGSFLLIEDLSQEEINATLTATRIPEPFTVECAGFEPPMNISPVIVKGRKRALPLKAQLFDSEGYLITDTDINAPPVVQVFYHPGIGGSPVEANQEVLSVGQGIDGNQFVFTDELKWQLNLKTTNFTAPGTYTIYMDTGDDTEYIIDPTCYSEFIRE